MAVFWLVFAAQEAGVRYRPLDCLLGDAAVVHEGDELALVGLPVSVAAAVGVEHFLGRSEVGEVDVVHLADLAEEVFEVVLLGEAGQLGNVVQPHIHQTLCA